MKHFDFTLETPVGRAIRTHVDDETLPNAFFGPRYKWLTEQTEVALAETSRVVGTSFIECKSWSVDWHMLQTTVSFSNIIIIETARFDGHWQITLTLGICLPHSAQSNYVRRPLSKLIELGEPFDFLNQLQIISVSAAGDAATSVVLKDDWHRMNAKLREM